MVILLNLYKIVGTKNQYFWQFFEKPSKLDLTESIQVEKEVFRKRGDTPSHKI